MRIPDRIWRTLQIEALKAGEAFGPFLSKMLEEAITARRYRRQSAREEKGTAS